MKRNILAFALLAVSSAAHAGGGEGSTCGIVLESCPAGELMASNKDDRCESTSSNTICYPITSAPPQPSLDCVRIPTGFACSAWPKTALATQPLGYTWSVTGTVQLVSGGTDPSKRTLRCTTPTATGIVRVEISSPVDPELSSTVSRILECRQGGMMTIN